MARYGIAAVFVFALIAGYSIITYKEIVTLTVVSLIGGVFSTILYIAGLLSIKIIHSE